VCGVLLLLLLLLHQLCGYLTGVRLKKHEWPFLVSADSLQESCS
jgi:hypothetical protein